MPRSSAVTAPSRPRKAPHRPRVYELACPLCGESVGVPESDLVEGAAMRCDHCGFDPVLTRETDDLTGRRHWLLADPFEGQDDERR